jgi:hypothetical protein
MSSTGSSGFASLTGQSCMLPPAAATAGTAVVNGPDLATVATAAAQPAGSSGYAGLSDCDITTEAGAGFAGHALALTEAELDALIDDKFRTAGMQLDSSTPTAAAAEETAGGLLLEPMLLAPNFSSNSSASSAGSFGDGDFIMHEGYDAAAAVFGDVTAGPAGFALLDESELDAIIEQEMLAAGMLVPAGSGSSGFVLASTPSGVACTETVQYVHPELQAPSATAAPAAPALLVHAEATAGMAAAAVAAAAATPAAPAAPALLASAEAAAGMAAAPAAAGAMTPLMTGAFLQTQPLAAANAVVHSETAGLLPAPTPAQALLTHADAVASMAADAMGPLIAGAFLQAQPMAAGGAVLHAQTAGLLPAPAAPSAAALAAPPAAAASGYAMLPSGAAGVLHASQSARLDALISELVGLTATLQQLKQQQQAGQLQQEPQGMVLGQVDPGLQSYSSMADTWFHNSL